LMKAGILDNPLRCAAFFATIGIESAGMTVLRENMNYSAKQIEKVFGVGRHSAAVKPDESRNLAGKPYELAERVYGLGNPKKAKELGNTKPGDGWLFRGLGPIQNTGRRAITDLMVKVKAKNVDDLFSRQLLFAGAINFWLERGINRYADVDDTRNVRRAVNGGYNGYDEFMSFYSRLVEILNSGHSAQEISKDDSNARSIQTMLVELGYEISIDGKYGPQTTNAVKDFQRRNNLTVDGIAGPITFAAIHARLDTNTLAEPPVLPVMSDQAQKATGAGAIGVGAAGEVIMTVAREMTALKLDSVLFSAIPPGLMLIGLGFMVFPLIWGKK